METLDLRQAAQFLKKSIEVTRRAAAKGSIPAAKVGGSWVFLLDDLVEFLRSRYSKTAETSWGVIKTDRRKTWHSIKEVTSGGLPLATKELAYKKAVGLQIK
jgi:hypothetical protein